MNRFDYWLIGLIPTKFVKRIYYPNHHIDKFCLILQDQLFQNQHYTQYIQQIEFDSFHLDIIHRKIIINQLFLQKNNNNILLNKSSHQNLWWLKFSTLFLILGFIYYLFFSVFYLFLSSIFLSILLSFIFLIVLSISIKEILKNTKFCINSLIIDLKIPINDEQENVNLKIKTESIDFLLNNFDNFALKIENVEFELKKQENDTIFTNIFLSDIEINRNEKTNFSIQLNNEIQIYYSLFDTNEIFKALKEKILSIKQKSDEKKDEKENCMNLDIKIPKIYFYLFQNDSILIKINAIPTNIQYSFNNGNNDIQTNFKIEIEAFYRAIYNLSNIFDIYFSNKNNHVLSCSINKFHFNLQKRENNKNLINIILPNLTIERKENNNYDTYSKDNILIYYSLFDTYSIFNLIIEIKNLIMKNFYTNYENDSQDQDIINNLLNLLLSLNLDIENIDLFLTKSNLPLLLFNTKSIKLQYHINNQQQINMEAKFELEHLCHQNYSVINRFSLVINYLQPNLDIYISPIQTTLTSFLIHEVLSLEKNDSIHSELDHQCENIYIKNKTGSNFQIQLTPKAKDQQKKELKVDLNFQKHINKQKYVPEIEVIINNKTYNFSIYDLYSPIFLDKNIVVSRNSLNGINSICFSSPFLIYNTLSYEIEVKIDDKNYFKIESMKKTFIPITANFSLSKQIKVSIFPSNDEFSILDFESTIPIKTHHDVKKTINKNIIDSNMLIYYSAYKLCFNHQSSICSIIFIPYITVTNYLPFELTFIIKDIAVLQLEQNKPADISFLYNAEKEFNFILDFNDIAIGNKVVSKKISNFEEEICLLNNNQKVGKIIFRCLKQKVGKKDIFKIAIFSPLILKNETPIPLFFKETKEISYQFINKTIFYSSKSLLNNSCNIKLPIYVQNFTEVNSSDFKYVGSFSQVIPLKHIKYENIYFLISLKKYQSNYNDSSQIKIKQYLTVYNETDHEVFFVPTEQNKDNYFDNVCPKGKSVIFGSNNDALFYIYINEYQYCKNFNFFTLGSSIIRFVKINDPSTYFLLKFTVKKDDYSNCYCCIISNPELKTHIHIKNNLLDKDIFVHQHFQPILEDFKYHPMIINPNEELIYAKEQPFIGSELTSPYNINVSIGNDDKKYHVKFDEDCQMIRIQDTQYYYTVKRENFDYLNIVFDELNYNSNRTNSENISYDKSISYSINIIEFELSYIDNEIHELYLLDIKKASLKINEKIIFSIDGFALNDMYLASVSPVVIHGKENPFLYLEIDSKYPFKKFMFDNIALKFSPINIYVDFPFIGDLIASLKEITILASKLQNNIKGENNFLSKIFSANSISIEPIAFDLYSNSLENRKYRFKHPDYYNLLRFKIPIFKEINYEFIKINKYNVEAPVIDFFESLFEDYKNQFTFNKVIKENVENIFQLRPTTSNSFEDFLKYKSNGSNDDLLMQHPRRLPRAFPKKQIVNIPIIFNNLSIEYPDLYTNIQYLIQKKSIEYRNEKLNEVFELANDKMLAIFDNYVFIMPKLDSKIEILPFEYKKIGDVKNNSNILSFVINNKIEIFECKSEQEAHAIAKRMNSFILKIKISEKTV